ncbi:MAG: sugar phosphate isomerase/epimerase [Candidatus Hydrogenedentes bacterium]|nr:sugar phosphate isomerase/epimerase [Candidatus Hydrogenedentota bacterium]
MSPYAMNRRGFLQHTAAAGAGIALAASASRAAAEASFPPLQKALQYNKLPDLPTDPEKFALAKDAGFDGIEAYPMDDLDAAKIRGDQAREAGVPVHSITYGGWGAPMSSPDPEVIKKGQAEIAQALRTAHAMGCDTVLLVPAVVNEEVGYAQAWENSQKNIRPMIPLAEELGVVIAVENVWNKFLLSPLEFATYVDQFESPWVHAYFDIGNVVIFGYPEDWIRTLGKRIRRIHVKDFTRKSYEWSNLPYEGDVNWPVVRQALADIGYTGWVTEEFGRGDDAWLRELSRRMTLFAEGAATA